MRPARELDHGEIAAEQRFDVGEMLSDRDLVALPLVVLVPLIMVVKDQGYDVVEAVDESIGRRRVDEVVEPTVEIRKIMVSAVDFLQQRDMLLAKRFDLPPKL